MKDIPKESQELWQLVEECLSDIHSSGSTVKNKIKVSPILPNLITSTNKMTILATSTKVGKSQIVHIVATPTSIKTKGISSANRNNYTTTNANDSHLRGVRIVLNTTFTAGGLTAPVFVTVYGMTSNEMPQDEIVTVPVKELFVEGDRNVFCEEEGFITFVRGNHEEDKVEVDTDSTEEDDKTYYSKESRVARLHHELVYYPFIEKICKSRYGMQGDEVPDDLQAVSWSDGANAQIKHITNEETLKKDEELKITNCKHSAA